MEGVEITVRGFPQALAGMTVLSTMAYPDAVKTLQEAGREIAEDARAAAPVRTGALRASIKATDLSDGSLIEATVGYAGFVEFGTRRMQGRAFMSLAVDKFVDKLIAMWESRLTVR